MALDGTGLGLITAGLFHPDPGFGFPPGTANGPPKVLTYQSALHGVGFTLSFLSFVVACAVFARSETAGHRRYRAYTAVSAVGAVVLGMWPGTSAIALRDLGAALLLWTWITVQSASLLDLGNARSRQSMLEGQRGPDLPKRRRNRTGVDPQADGRRAREPS